MRPFDIAQGFIDECERSQELAILSSLFGQAIRQLGFRHFACLSHVDPLHPPAGSIVLLDYPRDWVDLFSQRQLERIDPVFVYADRSARPFHWSDPAFVQSLDARQCAILGAAAGLGLRDGYTIPLHAPGALPASCSLVPDCDRLDRATYRLAHLMAAYLHQAGMPRQLSRSAHGLTARERQCLELAAQGKSDWVIAQILGIGERTAHKHIEHAKRRLGVASRTQAIIQALFSHAISFGDVLRVTGGNVSLEDEDEIKPSV